MASQDQSFEDSILEWCGGRLSTGHRLSMAEHKAIMMIGEKVDDSSRPTGLTDELWKIIEGVQMDALPGVEQFAKKLGVSALEIAFYRQLWGPRDDEVLPGVVYRRVLVSKKTNVPDIIIKDFRIEVDRWRNRLLQVRAMIDRNEPEGLAMVSDQGKEEIGS